MATIAIAEREVPLPLSEAFALFIDFAHWSSWMPRTFAPVTGPARALQAGDRFKVRVGRLPISLDVIRLAPNREICWRGGSRWVMQGDHSFTFAEAGTKTWIRSEETLTGLLTLGPLAPRLSRAASAEADMMLGRFTDYAARHHAR